VQTAPVSRLPQLPFTHLMFGAQSLSDEQRVMQALVAASQPKGAQIVVGPVTQLPAPSQMRPPPREAPWQVPAWQTLPTT
jgi:hypothetical protein